ncbi:hypothetical protein BCR44DRAFT_34259 [Catenaria anguillulae PL171]|uniref:Ser-Thr-rich glycosyl-phosphatidyl-inositol-anchored membrane family-domain-containing protein n=1 Tax=Catenaria anguillulae PL171 TaxID=765915 RepID=A0A1Y2HN92_9FUNG|nr:hypothetical protein BCR44DRAFT_34259 [Catenaria anguillulae PL171]
MKSPNLLVLATAAAVLLAAATHFANAQIVTPHTPINEAWRAGQRITVTWDVDTSGAPTVEPMDLVDVYIMRCDSPACLNAIEVAKIGSSIDVNRKSLTANLPSGNLPPQPDYFVMIAGPTKREVKFSSKIPLGMTVEQGKSMLAAQSAAASSSAEAARAKATPTVTQTPAPADVVTVTVTATGSAGAKATGTGTAAAAAGKPSSAERHAVGVFAVGGALVVAVAGAALLVV